MRGKWIERNRIESNTAQLASSLVRGKWIERRMKVDIFNTDKVFPREREVD